MRQRSLRCVFNGKNDTSGKTSGDGKKKFLVPLIDEFVKEITDNKIYIEEIEGLR